MLTGNPGNLETFDYVGLHRYLLTLCTHSRHHHFVVREHVDLVLEQIVRSAADTGFAIVAYCFMPDHVHLVVAAELEASDCRQFIKRAKQFSGYYFKQRFRKSLWQRYGFERVLRNDEPTLGVARYTLENPVRAGLATCAEEYPFSGSLVYPIAEILAAVQMTPTGRSSGC